LYKNDNIRIPIFCQLHTPNVLEMFIEKLVLEVYNEIYAEE